MRVALKDVGRRARMDLAFALQKGETILRDCYCEAPFKVTRVLNSRRPLAHVIVMQCTAGLFGGDELECSIRVHRGAQVLITQQAATKVHPSHGRAAVQRNYVLVESGAELQLHLEPLIPFTESILRQTTQIDVQHGGTLVFWESFMAGRIGAGERWRFHELSLETRLTLDDRTVYLDRFRLPNGSECSAWAMADRNYLGAGLYVGKHAGGFVTRLHQVLPEAGVDTPVPDVGLVRVLSATGPDFHRCKNIFCRSADTGCCSPPAKPMEAYSVVL